MFSTYLDFEVIIGAPGAAGYPVSVHGPGGDARGDLALPTAPAYQPIIDRLMRLDTDEAALADQISIFPRWLHGRLRSSRADWSCCEMLSTAAARRDWATASHHRCIWPASEYRCPANAKADSASSTRVSASSDRA
jgi:hypothetical protein